ncbi:MAG: hypothetical protein GXP45_00225 [bacterium]|nr:hypothetical protein [bacterium]
MYGRRFELSYRRIFLSSFAIILIFSLVSLFLGTYSKYINVTTSNNTIPPIYQNLVKQYDGYEQKISKYIPISDYDQYANIKIYLHTGSKDLDNLLAQPKLNYVNKKNIIQRNIDEMSDGIFKEIKTLNTLKTNISKYGFLTEELYTLLQGQKKIQPIKQSLLSLEVIKFSSAMKVFSYLDTFLEGFASVVKVPTDQVALDLQTMMQRGENDIYTYLNDCYLNPFEWDYDCSAIGDFDFYYNVVKQDQGFNKDHFKKLIKYIDMKLEQTEIPSFSIVFRRFDPSKNTITFTIDVNTFQKDEIALLKKNILNPHMFIVTQLLNFLKQSIFVVGDSINVKNLDVENKIVQIGNQKFNINHSRMSFSLPIQKSSQREIFDFVDNVDNINNVNSVQLGESNSYTTKHTTAPREEIEKT